jgi:hypothetical protein
MRAIKAHFDGKHIVVPADLQGLPPGDVIVVFDETGEAPSRQDWLRAQEETLAKVWNNDEDAVYDDL